MKFRALLLASSVVVCAACGSGNSYAQQAGTYGYESEEHLGDYISHYAASGFVTGFGTDDHWSGGPQLVDGTIQDFATHSWSDVFLVNSHGDIGQWNLFQSPNVVTTYDVQQPLGGQIASERWLYVVGCQALIWQALDPSTGEPLGYRPWYNVFGSALHGVYGYAAPVVDSINNSTWMSDVATMSWRQGSSNPPSAYTGYVDGTQSAQLPWWGVVDGANSHNDAVSAAPNANVTIGDSLTAIGPLYQYWGDSPSDPVPSPTPLATMSQGTAVQSVALRPESIDSSYWINKYSDGTQTVYNSPGVTLVTKPGGAAILYQNSGGVEYITDRATQPVAFGVATARTTAEAFIRNNGGMPGDAVLRHVATAVKAPLDGSIPPAVIGDTFYYTHASPVVGFDGITISVDEEGYDKCVSGYWTSIPDPHGGYKQLWVCTQYQFVSQPTVTFYYRLWRTLVYSNFTSQAFSSTVSGASILASVDHSHSITGHGYAYWTPPMEWNAIAQQVATPVQFYEVDNRLRVDYDLNGTYVGEGGAL